MIDGRYLAKRLIWTALAFYLVLSAMFLVNTWATAPTEDRTLLTEDPDEEALEEALAAHEDRSLADRWIDWLGAFTTGDLGAAKTYDLGDDASFGTPILDLVLSRGLVTLLYVLPGLVLATLLGTVTGLYSALATDSRLESLLTPLAYGPIGVPAFVLAEALLLVLTGAGVAIQYHPSAAPLSAPNVGPLGLAMLVVVLNHGAVKFRHARAASATVATSELAARLRGRGFSTRRVGRHVLAIAAPTLLAASLVETLGTLFFTVFVVELVLKLPGLGQLGWFAIQNGDVRLFTAITMLPIVLGLLGQFCIDIGRAVRDPRTDEE